MGKHVKKLHLEASATSDYSMLKRKQPLVRQGDLPKSSPQDDEQDEEAQRLADKQRKKEKKKAKREAKLLAAAAESLLMLDPNFASPSNKSSQLAQDEAEQLESSKKEKKKKKKKDKEVDVAAATDPIATAADKDEILEFGSEQERPPPVTEPSELPSSTGTSETKSERRARKLAKKEAKRKAIEHKEAKKRGKEREIEPVTQQAENPSSDEVEQILIQRQSENSATKLKRKRDETEKTDAASQPKPKKAKKSGSPKKSSQAADTADTADLSQLSWESILSTKWISPKNLLQIAKEKGENLKQGKFSDTEDSLLEHALQSWRVANNLSHPQLLEIIHAPRRPKPGDHDTVAAPADFWSTVTLALPDRHVSSVYSRAKRMYDPLARQIKWDDEQDASLRNGVTEFGTQWKKIAPQVGRSAADCKDRYTKVLSTRDDRKRGAWTTAEKEELQQAVESVGENWGAVEKLFKGKRTAAQCRATWKDSVELRGLKSRQRTFQPKLRATLVHEIAAMNVLEATEIQFAKIENPDLKIHGAKNLQERWRWLTQQALDGLRAVHRNREGKDYPGDGMYPFKDVMEWLLTRYPTPGDYMPTSQYEKRQRGNLAGFAANSSGIKSAARIESSDEASDED